MVELPIFAVIPEIRAVLQGRDELVLEAPPGAGKTTQVPLSLLQEHWLTGQKILMLEPRRLAARAAAERMAQTLAEPVGETVGYRVRLDSRVGHNTRIEVVTEGILTRMLQDDPSLEGVGLLIFDEFHERSLDADLGLALARQGRSLYGDLREQPLKILVMSATLDGGAVSEFLNSAPVVRSEGKMHPVDIRYGRAYRYGERIVERVVDTTLQALADESGSVLVFLPGQGEIRQACQMLQDQLQRRVGQADPIQLCPLFGDLSLAEQRRAIEPAANGMRKVVLATSIAETSLTIEGIRVVVDAGLSRLPVFDPNTGMTRLTTQRVSRASATQRAGRAGRLEPGVCYRLWSASQQDELPQFTAPEIQQVDLSPLALQLLHWGIGELSELDWLESPPRAAYQQALELLQQLQAAASQSTPSGAVQWRITALGQSMMRLPTHPRLAHMMVRAQAIGKGAAACELAALLSERDFLGAGSGADLERRLEYLRGERQPARTQQAALSRIRQQQKHLQRLLSALEPTSAASAAGNGNNINDGSNNNAGDAVVLSDREAVTGVLLAFAYPDRIARQRPQNLTHYQLSNGRGAVFREQDSLCKHAWLAIAAIGGQQGNRSDQIFLAAPLQQKLIELFLADLLTRDVVVEWDEQSEKLVAERRLCLGKLVLEREPASDLSDQQRHAALLGLVRRRGLELFSWTPELTQWRARIELLRAHSSPDTDPPWPDMSEQGLLDSLALWLQPYLSGVTKLSHFKSLDLASMLKGLLPWPLPQRLDEEAPAKMVVPSGSQIAIDYTQTPPVLAVKLQEMFGCEATPTVARGQVSLMVHLLSPAQRPLQVTQDLAGFWRGSYEQVKKEMKGRYPKHPWPDNPLQAQATSKTKNRL